MPNWKRVIVSGSDATLTSVTATAGFTGSLQGTASYATNALSASYAPPAFPFTGSALITGSLGVTGSASIRGTFNQASASLATGLFAHAQGFAVTASGIYSHAEGQTTKSSGSYSHAEGYGTQAKGAYSHAEGYLTTTNAESSHAEGYSTITSGVGSHAEGYGTNSSAYFSHAEGAGTNSSGRYSHAEGAGTTSGGIGSHAEGGYEYFDGDADVIVNGGTATGNASHAEGLLTTANGQGSHAEGLSTLASGEGSHAEGYGTIALGNYQHVQGQYNISSSVQSAFILGNGTSLIARSNLIFAAGSTVQITGSLVVTAGITGSMLGTASYATQALSASYAPGGAGTPTFPYTGSAIISGSLTVTGSLFVQDINGIINIDSSNRKLYDTITSQSVNWDERRLYDNAGNRAVAWQNKVLGESNGGSSVGWDYPNLTYAVEFSSYTRNNIDLGGVGEKFANFPYYAAFLPQGEILKNGVTVDATVADFDLVYLETNNTWYPVSVAATGSQKMLGVAFGIANFDPQVLIEGTMVVNDGTYTDTPKVNLVDHGLPIYIKTGTGTFMSTTAPGSPGSNVRVLGHAYYQSATSGSYWIMKFRPSNSWVTI